MCFLALFCLLSCGLEEFFYIDYIEEESVSYFDNRTTLRLPSSSAEGYNYFSNFIIFYRIYISNIPILGIIDSSTQRGDINITLNSDFNNLLNLTDKTSTSVNTANLETTFYNRQYFKLALETGADIDNVLGSGSLGRTLEIVFPTNDMPTLTVTGGTSYPLQRARSRPATEPFYIKPDDGFFLNHPDLYNTANATSGSAISTVNADVVTNTKTDSEMRYTYVSLYIAAKGRSLEMPPKDIFSQPTFIGIFRLADPN